MADAVVLDRVSRDFGPIHAVRDVSLTVKEGSIHALVGENGAGKSTCLALISGRVRAGSGSVRVLGRDVTRMSVRARRSLGIAAVYQEPNVFRGLTAAESTVLGRVRGGRLGWLGSRQIRQEYEGIATTVGLHVHPDLPNLEASIAQMHLIELGRALRPSTRLLILDEPTAALPPAERERLFDQMRSLAAAGVTILFVSHNLPEVLDIAETVTVFRDGRIVETRDRVDWTVASIVEQMIGETLSSPVAVERVVREEEALRVDQLRVPGKLEGISFRVARGEIVGVAGLAGSGRSTLLKALAGGIPTASGQVSVHQAAVSSVPRSFRRGLQRGLAYLPEDRAREGVFLTHPVWQNILVTRPAAARRLGLVTTRRGVARTRELARAATISVRRLDAPAATLSGGNQQKLLIARLLLRPPQVLLADEPTRGVDLKAVDDIWRSLRELAARGMAVVVVSSELEELMLVCDRLLVLAQGVVTHEVQLDETNKGDARAVLMKAFSVTSDDDDLGPAV